MKYLVMILMLAVLIAGCTEGTQEQQEQTNTETTETSGTEQQQTETAPSQPLAQTSDVSNELTRLMEQQFNMNYHVDYETTMSGSGMPEETMTMSYYMQGIQRMRIDTKIMEMETRSYIVDEKYTTCTKLMGAWTCMDFSSDEDYEYDETPSTTTWDESTINEVDQGTVTRLPPRTIAGQVSSCYRVEHEGSLVDYCYTADGVPTYVRTFSDYDGSTSETEMIATYVSKTIPTGTFDLPAAATSFEDMDIAAIMDQYGMN